MFISQDCSQIFHNSFDISCAKTQISLQLPKISLQNSHISYAGAFQLLNFFHPWKTYFHKTRLAWLQKIVTLVTIKIKWQHSLPLNNEVCIKVDATPLCAVQRSFNSYQCEPFDYKKLDESYLYKVKKNVFLVSCMLSW